MTETATAERSTVDTGPVDQLADWLVRFLVVFITMRIPGSLFVAAACSVLLLMILPLRSPRSQALPWLNTMVTATVASSIGVLTVARSPEVINFATITIVFLTFSCALLLSDDGQRLARIVITTLYWCFAGIMLIGLGEIATGVRVSHLLYPELKWAPVKPGPFEVSAFYPNYNDFSVVIAMFATMVAIRILFDHTSFLRTSVRCSVFTIAAGLIFLQGSRGALLALMLGAGAALWINLRTSTRSTTFTLATVVLAVLALASIAVLWESPWVQDNSTKVRGQVLERVTRLAPDETMQFWFGWGDRETYRDVGQIHFPGELTDPHNVIFEAFIWYGFPVAVLFVVFWACTTWRGIRQLPLLLAWDKLSAVLMVVLFPVLGIVPSSTFRYYFIFLFGAAASTALITRSSS